MAKIKNKSKTFKSLDEFDKYFFPKLYKGNLEKLKNSSSNKGIEWAESSLEAAKCNLIETLSPGDAT